MIFHSTNVFIDLVKLMHRVQDRKRERERTILSTNENFYFYMGYVLILYI